MNVCILCVLRLNCCKRREAKKNWVNIERGIPRRRRLRQLRQQSSERMEHINDGFIFFIWLVKEIHVKFAAVIAAAVKDNQQQTQPQQQQQQNIK